MSVCFLPVPGNNGSFGALEALDLAQLWAGPACLFKKWYLNNVCDQINRYKFLQAQKCEPYCMWQWKQSHFPWSTPTGPVSMEVYLEPLLLHGNTHGAVSDNPLFFCQFVIWDNICWEMGFEGQGDGARVTPAPPPAFSIMTGAQLTFLGAFWDQIALFQLSIYLHYVFNPVKEFYHVHSNPGFALHQLQQIYNGVHCLEIRAHSSNFTSGSFYSYSTTQGSFLCSNCGHNQASWASFCRQMVNLKHELCVPNSNWKHKQHIFSKMGWTKSIFPLKGLMAAYS